MDSYFDDLEIKRRNTHIYGNVFKIGTRRFFEIRYAGNELKTTTYGDYCFGNYIKYHYICFGKMFLPHVANKTWHKKYMVS